MKTITNLNVALIAISALSITLSSCKKEPWIGCKRANGNMSTEVRNLEAFDEIELTGSGDVYLIQDSGELAYTVEVEASKNILDRIETKVNGGKLTIKSKCITGDDHRTFKIYVPDLSRVSVSGSGSVTTVEKFKLNKVDIAVSGSGDVDFDTDAKDITVEISGSGNMHFTGTTDVLDIQISGSGDVKAFDLITEECMVSISGAGDCEVYTNKRLDVDISGSGNVTYDGNPSVVNLQSSGSGNISKR